MRDLGEFVSVFKRALRDQFVYQRLDFKRIFLITDLEVAEVDAYKAQVKSFLAPEFAAEDYELISVSLQDWSNWADLKIHLENEDPDLVVTYRLLRVANPEIVTSLGVYVDCLTQITSYPVLLLPNPHFPSYEYSIPALKTVMVATEHMYADHSLINYGIRFTPKGNRMLLCHVEDEATFDYYMKAIERIPELDNDAARENLGQQLIAMASQYADSVASEIETHKKQVSMEPVIKIGHIIKQYRELIAKEPVSLLVFTTKDDTQLAMHSLGYSLAVEFRNMPVLLL